jgi:hypothetical protein
VLFNECSEEQLKKKGQNYVAEWVAFMGSNIGLEARYSEVLRRFLGLATVTIVTRLSVTTDGGWIGNWMY